MTDPVVIEDRVRSGMVIGGGDAESISALAQRAEKAGLDSIWVGDHISFYIPILESLTLLSYMAGAT